MTTPDELIARFQTFISLKSPSHRNVASFLNWIRAHKPLTVEESSFLEHKDDFVALADGQENGWLDGVVEDCLNFFLPGNLMRVCCHQLRPLTQFFFCISEWLLNLPRKSSLHPINPNVQTISIFSSIANTV